MIIDLAAAIEEALDKPDDEDQEDDDEDSEEDEESGMCICFLELDYFCSTNILLSQLQARKVTKSWKRILMKRMKKTNSRSR